MKLNSDIETLNSNQDKIIDFIHKNFNASSNPMSGAKDSKDSESEDEEEENEPTSFQKLFRTELKEKTS